MAPIDFNLWKWRALHGRRLFFFCVLQVVLIFSWLTIRRIVHHNQSWTDKGTASTGYREFYEDVPIMFYISHALLLITVLFTNVGRNLVHESQGKRLCDWSAFSLILALIFLLQPLNTIEEKALNDTRSATFSTVALLGLALFQHLGTSEPILTITMCSIILLWILFLSFQGLSGASVVTVVFVLIAFAVLSRMQEYEFHRAYIKQKDSLQGSSYSSTAYDDIMYDAALSSHGPGSFGPGSFGGNLAVFMEDTMTALKAMEYAIAQQEDMLNRDDLLMECEMKVLPTLMNQANENEGGDALAPVSASAAGKDQEVVSWKLTTHAASLQINKLLCQSLYFAVSNSEELARMPGTSFSFNKICNQMFALFEGVRGNSLTLYANETVSEVLIIAPKSMFELIIFLLLHDAVHSDDRRICCLSCETSVAHGWHVSIQSITLEKSPLRANNNNNNHGAGHHHPLESNSSTHSGSSGDNHAPKASAGSAAGGMMGGNSNEMFHFGKGLMLNENVTTRNRPMERLAERLTLKYLKSSIQYIDPEYRAGVRVDQKIIPLSSDRCMLAPTHDSLTFAMTQQQQQLSARHAPNSGNGGGEDSGAPPPQRTGQDNLQWLFVVQRNHDLEGMGEIRDKMKNLCIPFRIKALSELRDPAHSHSPLQYSVMVIDEIFLSKLLKDKDKSKFKFLRGMPLKWVVVTDPKKLSSATDIKVLYGIDAESLSSKASMPELFDCVQIVTHKLAPRTSPDVLSSFSDYDDFEAQKFRSQSNAHPSYGLPYRRAARAADRSEAEAVKRWLFLVRQFKAVASKLYANDSQLLNGLDARMKDIEDLRDVNDNLEALLSVPGYQGPLADMNSHKKKAKYIMDTYQPHLAKLNAKLETFDLVGIHNLAAKCAVQSSTLGLLRLSCWFTTVQEIVSITMTIMDTKDYLRGGPDGDKSVSISFTSVGRALASRSHPHAAHSHPHNTGAGALGVPSSIYENSLKFERNGNSATIPLSTSNSINLGGSGTNLVADKDKDNTFSNDHMTLDDVSDGESGTAHGDGQGTTADTAPLGANSRANSLVNKTEVMHGAAPTPHVSFSAATSSAPTGVVGAMSIISPQAKVIDAGLRAIIADMVRGIEVAVWDAAMER